MVIGDCWGPGHEDMMEDLILLHSYHKILHHKIGKLEACGKKYSRMREISTLALILQLFSRFPFLFTLYSRSCVVESGSLISI